MTINKKKKQRNITRYIRLFSLTGALFAYSAGVALAVPQNVTLPTGWQFVGGSGTINSNNNIMDIVQNGTNAAIKWDSFSIGGNAIVNFSKDGGGNFNVLNYVNAGPVSEIYGTINATNGNVFVVNPAGVTIGKSAQINVGSLYVSNQKLKDDVLDDVLTSFDGKADTLKQGEITAGELMHLGYINAAQGKVTFVGDRIVLDADRIRDTKGEQLAADKINVTTNNTDNLVIGYNEYDAVGKYNQTEAQKQEVIAKVNGQDYTKEDGYMWIDNVQQLQAMNTNVSGNYALHNSIDAVETSTWTGGFTSVIGKDDSHNDVAFSGSFDGLGYNIFDLNIKGKDATTNVGLFAKTDGAAIKNINLVGGTITGGNNVGAIVGSASHTTISNITTSANVTGKTNVGGIVGSATDSSTLKDLVNIGGITGKNSGDASFDSVNVGGIVGNMNGGKLSGSTYNIGRVTGGHEVGGLVGYAQNDATLGDENGTQIYNKMDISGGYNVGGIVGRMEGGTVVNAANYNSITATGATKEEYYYYGATNAGSGNASTEVIGNVKHAKKEADSNKLGDDGNTETAVANVGGIAGNSKDTGITKVINEGNVQSIIAGKDYTIDYYKAGNVGGIVGRAEDTIITDAANKENKVSGAHNVGGIAGYLGATEGHTASISNSVNNGGFIYGTGARDENGNRLTEWVRPIDQGTESNIIGNVGGIVGYVYGGGSDSNGGGSVSISNAGNRGTVSVSEYFNKYSNKDMGNGNRTRAIANVGGIVGKLDVGNEYGNDVLADTIDAKVSDKLDKIKSTDTGIHIDAVINNSYNSGAVSGMQNVGGIVGMMYNGSVADSYNLGNIKSLVTEDSVSKGPIWVNMGGIVGGTTENVTARGILYNVYNDGIIGDSKYETGGIHVGGVAGRLSGYMEQSYNTGAVYNIAQGTGGVMGALWKANVKNVFNAGNVTLLHKNYAGNIWSAGVGGIIGVKVAETEDYLTNVYNIGVIRGFIGYNGDPLTVRHNAVGGIIGSISAGTLNITNAYTRGELYAGKYKYNNGKDIYEKDEAAFIGAVYGMKFDNDDKDDKETIIVPKATYYIKPDINSSIFSDLNDLDSVASETDIDGKKVFRGKVDNIQKSIEIAKANDYNSYINNGDDSFDFSYANGEKQGEGTGDWRIYDGSSGRKNYNSGTTPILDCFRPAAVEYFGRAEQADKGDFAARREGIDYIQYGTAYNPFMTIMYAGNGRTEPIKLDFGNIGVSSKGGFAVYNGGLSITNFGTSGNQMFNGVIYSDGDLSIDTKIDGTYNGMSIKLGGASELYGSSVTLDTDNGVEIYGKIKATGNAHFKKLVSDGSGNTSYNYNQVNVNNKTRGDVIINGGDVEIYGHVSSAKANYKEENGSVTKDESGATQINGIRGGRNNNNAQYTVDNIGSIDEENHPVPDLGEFYAYKAGEYEGSIHGNGSIKITATAKAKGTQGTVKAMLGSLDKGYLESFGAMEITGSDIYIDSDLRAGGDLTLDAATTVLDISNIVQVDSKDSAGSTVTSVQRLHNFLNNFSGENAHKLILKNGENATDAIIAADMWDDTKNAYDLGKYDLKDDHGTTITTFSNAVYALNVLKDRTETKLGRDDVQKLAHIWVENGEQLKGIQSAESQGALYKNFALKDDIDMFGVSDYTSIGTDSKFTGNFDGRGNRIIGFGSGEAGIFKTIGKQASVKDVKIYNSRIGGTGATDSTGLLADDNKGTIENVTTFGNRVEIASVPGGGLVGPGGGLVGTNSGTISNVTTSDIVTSQAEAILGGIVGTNNNQGTIKNVTANSAVVGQNAAALGGVVGKNEGEILHAASTHGVISGLFGGANLNDINEYGCSQNIGGVVGINDGKIDSAYNDSYINGWNNIGGVIGTNSENGNVENIVNGSEMYGGSNIGGIVGENGGTIDNGRNNGAIVADANHVLDKQGQGGTLASGANVGGLAGVNSGSMSNLVNDISAAIEGYTNVGGIIGLNQGFLSSAQNLMNQGEILGVTFVGGIVGENGNDGVVIKVENTNDYTLGYNKAYSDQGEFFGGIVGHNIGTVGDATNNATITVDNENVQYVGGIIGKNDGKIAQAGDTFNKTIIADGYLINNGKVTATKSEYVGGLIGENNGTIRKTNLINSITGEVSGKSNVGGLIGHNIAEVEGGRDDGDNYYAYQVYNNGTVTGAGDNVGGLVGNNDANGALSAGYNTGAISGKSNVGGVVGNNAANAKVDQVFNAGAVTGTAVGTVVGYNYGTVTNAYDMAMTDNTTGAIGGGNSTNVDNTTDANGSNVWKTYGDKDDYGTNKLLSVFLTKLNFVQTALTNLVYDAQNHKITVKEEGGKVKVFKDNVEIGYFKPASDNEEAAHSLADYLNTNKSGLSSLLSGVSFKDAGEHQIFNTQQIDTEGNNGNPNNLGFDVTNIKVGYDGNPPKFDDWEDKYSWYYGWDKKREERERKAEVHFVDGGMELN